MKNRRLARIALPAALASILLAGCFDDPMRSPKSQDVSTPQYREPTSKENVLFNLALAYGRMDIDHYAGALEPADFVFTFEFPRNQIDVPDAWNHDQEIAAATYMFGGGGGIRDAPVRAIDVTLLNLDTVVWAEVDPGAAYPGETWYQGGVQYSFTVDADNDVRWISAGKPYAQFTLRPHDTGDATEWKIVRWRDAPDLPDRRVPAGSAPDGVENISWSFLKYIYSGDAP